MDGWLARWIEGVDAWADEWSAGMNGWMLGGNSLDKMMFGVASPLLAPAGHLFSR